MCLYFTQSHMSYGQYPGQSLPTVVLLFNTFLSSVATRKWLYDWAFDGTVRACSVLPALWPLPVLGLAASTEPLEAGLS